MTVDIKIGNDNVHLDSSQPGALKYYNIISPQLRSQIVFLFKILFFVKHEKTKNRLIILFCRFRSSSFKSRSRHHSNPIKLRFQFTSLSRQYRGNSHIIWSFLSSQFVTVLFNPPLYLQYPITSLISDSRSRSPGNVNCRSVRVQLKNIVLAC